MVSTALVAIFVDMENVGGQFIRSVADFGATQGRVCHLAVYGDWRRGYGQHWDTTLDVGGVPTQILRTGGKNSADIAIVVDVMEFLSLTPTVQVYVLATGDSDFVPLAQKLRSRGKVVIGVAPKGRSVADTLVAACDRFERLNFDKATTDKVLADKAIAEKALLDGTLSGTGSPDGGGEDRARGERDSGVSAPKGASGSRNSLQRPDDGSEVAEDLGRDRPPSRAKPAAAEGHSGANPSDRTPTIEQVRALLAEMLSHRGAMTTGAIGNLLQQAMPGFRHRALGHRTLSDLLRAQSDLLEVIPTAHELRVTLLPGVRPPEGEDPEPYELGEAPEEEELTAQDRDTGAGPDEQQPQGDDLEEFFTALPEPALPEPGLPEPGPPAASEVGQLPATAMATAPAWSTARTLAGAPGKAMAAPAPSGVLWPALLRHLGGVDLTAHPEAREQLAAHAVLALSADVRGEATRQMAMAAGIPLTARRATWLADCAALLAQLGGEDAVLDRIERLDAPAKKALLLALPGVGPSTAEAVLAALEPALDRAPPQNLLLF